MSPADQKALAEFDHLPDSAHVRVAVVAALEGGVDTSTVWRRAAAGQLPAGRKLSAGVTAWRVGDLRQHYAALADAAD